LLKNNLLFKKKKSKNDFLAWFNPGWQPQAQLGDGKAPQINVTQNLSCLNHADFFLSKYA